MRIFIRACHTFDDDMVLKDMDLLNLARGIIRDDLQVTR